MSDPLICCVFLAVPRPLEQIQLVSLQNTKVAEKNRQKRGRTSLFEKVRVFKVHAGHINLALPVLGCAPVEYTPARRDYIHHFLFLELISRKTTFQLQELRPRWPGTSV